MTFFNIFGIAKINTSIEILDHKGGGAHSDTHYNINIKYSHI